MRVLALTQGVPVAEDSQKTEFCAFLVRKCDYEMYHADAAVRTALYDVIAETYKSCTPLGLCRYDACVTTVKSVLNRMCGSLLFWVAQ